MCQSDSCSGSCSWADVGPVAHRASRAAAAVAQPLRQIPRACASASLLSPCCIIAHGRRSLRSLRPTPASRRCVTSVRGGSGGVPRRGTLSRDERHGAGGECLAPPLLSPAAYPRPQCNHMQRVLRCCARAQPSTPLPGWGTLCVERGTAPRAQALARSLEHWPTQPRLCGLLAPRVRGRCRRVPISVAPACAAGGTPDAVACALATLNSPLDPPSPSACMGMRLAWCWGVKCPTRGLVGRARMSALSVSVAVSGCGPLRTHAQGEARRDSC